MSQTLKDTKTVSCLDKNCPIHGNLSIRGKTLTGRVVSDRMHKTVVVQVDYLYFYPKYKRYAKRRSKIHAHNPPCIGAVKGEIVKIAECRPLSKTVGFVVVERTSGE